jgi:hypothetical protein
MKVLLMHRDRDFELYRPASQNRYVRRQEVDRDTLLRAVLWNAPDLTKDLELNTLLRAMAGADDFVLEVAQQAFLSGLRNDFDTILYRNRNGLTAFLAKDLFPIVSVSTPATRLVRGSYRICGTEGSPALRLR